MNMTILGFYDYIKKSIKSSDGYFKISSQTDCSSNLNCDIQFEIDKIY